MLDDPRPRLVRSQLVEQPTAHVDGGALELLDALLLGHLAFHRRPDAWDLIDDYRRVAAVICVRKSSGFVTISLPAGPERRQLRPDGPIVMPYAEEVVAHVTVDGRPPKRQRKKDSVMLSVAQARQFIARLVAAEELARGEGIRLAEEAAAN